VLGGALSANGMVSFKRALKSEQAESIRAYLVSRAIDLKNNPPRIPFGPAPTPSPSASPSTQPGPH